MSNFCQSFSVIYAKIIEANCLIKTAQKRYLKLIKYTMSLIGHFLNHTVNLVFLGRYSELCIYYFGKKVIKFAEIRSDFKFASKIISYCGCSSRKSVFSIEIIKININELKLANSPSENLPFYCEILTPESFFLERYLFYMSREIESNIFSIHDTATPETEKSINSFKMSFDKNILLQTIGIIDEYKAIIDLGNSFILSILDLLNLENSTNNQKLGLFYKLEFALFIFTVSGLILCKKR